MKDPWLQDSLEPGDIPRKEARRIWDASLKRLQKHKSHPSWNDPTWYERWQIKIKGRWHDVVRTDLFDDVCTSTLEKKAQPLSFWRSKIRYGARIKPKRSNVNAAFACIDSVTDG